MVFWLGVKWPYHKMLTVMLPMRTDPLWYFKTVAGVCKRASLRGIVAAHGWNMVEMRRREEAKNVKDKMGIVCMVLLLKGRVGL
ncbi:hypothetical protein Hanom_Chr02g00136431 [Helianthus anomalus]